MELGFVRLENDTLTLTDLGRRVNLSNLEPVDAAKVLSMPSFDVDSILTTASQIDIAKKYVIPYGQIAHPAKVLKAWMGGPTLDAIRQSCGNYYDQDVIDLASYTSLSLLKISLLVDNKLKDKVLKIREKLNDRSRSAYD